MTQDEKKFSRDLGARIAQLRKEENLTQQQLAELMGMSQLTDSREALAGLLAQFRFWYNAVRPHQHLGGLTPEEVWRGIDPYARAPKAVHLFEAWGGLLRGYYLRH